MHCYINFKETSSSADVNHLFSLKRKLTFEFYSENSEFFTSRRGSRKQMLGGKCEL